MLWIHKGKNEYASFIDNANPKNYYTPSIVLYEVYKKIKKELSDEKVAPEFGIQSPNG